MPQRYEKHFIFDNINRQGPSRQKYRTAPTLKYILLLLLLNQYDIGIVHQLIKACNGLAIVSRCRAACVRIGNFNLITRQRIVIIGIGLDKLIAACQHISRSGCLNLIYNASIGCITT